MARPILFKFPTILVKLDGIGKNHKKPHKDSIYNRDLLEQEPKIGSSKQSLKNKRVESVIELTESTQKVNNMDENRIQSSMLSFYKPPSIINHYESPTFRNTKVEKPKL